MFKFAQLAALQGRVGSIVLVNACILIENFVRALYGHVDALARLSLLLDNRNLMKWHCIEHLAFIGDTYPLLDRFESQIHEFNFGVGSAAVVFSIGGALNGHVDKLSISITFKFLHVAELSSRRAVNAWTLLGIRVGVVRYIRTVIGKMIREARYLALYSTVEQRPNRCLLQ